MIPSLDTEQIFEAVRALLLFVHKRNDSANDATVLIMYNEVDLVFAVWSNE